jgi:hypothetical protein
MQQRRVRPILALDALSTTVVLNVDESTFAATLDAPIRYVSSYAAFIGLSISRKLANIRDADRRKPVLTFLHRGRALGVD